MTTEEIVTAWRKFTEGSEWTVEWLSPTKLRSSTRDICDAHGVWIEADAASLSSYELIHGDPHSEARKRFPLHLSPRGLRIADRASEDAWIDAVHKYEAGNTERAS